MLISITISNPEQLIQAQSLRQVLKCKIIYQKVDACGRAKKNQLTFDYPTFQEGTLLGKCPNLEVLSYISGKGFTTCCCNLVFNHDNPAFSNKTYNGFIKSKFYHLISQNTFVQIMKTLSTNKAILQPTDSSPCNLCESIYLNSIDQFEKNMNTKI